MIPLKTHLHRQRQQHVILLLLSFLLQTASSKPTFQDLSYSTYPQRQTSEAAIIEWGNSAVISALDAAVSTFGQQTSRGAFFEVETNPILASPLDASAPLQNADELRGNMAIMTNSHPSTTPVQMALMAQEAGAVALMVVNTRDASSSSPDYIYSMTHDEGEEEDAERVDIPVVMVSVASGNLLTSAGEEKGTMPERVRLYAASDRPFFEDISSDKPVLYLIHNILTDVECETLLNMAKTKVEEVHPNRPNVLEGYDAIPTEDVKGLRRAYLWNGSVVKGPVLSTIDEKMEQVTGFPKEHWSDFQLNMFQKGGYHGLHYDVLPGSKYVQTATITIFLNDVEEGEGGEIVYPDAEDGPIKILPRKGMAVVHHTVLDEEEQIDTTSLYGELTFSGNEKWTATRWVYMMPVSRTRRFVLPLLAAPFGGKLPRKVIELHDGLLEKFGFDQGGEYFDKLVMGSVVLILFGLVQGIGLLVKGSVARSGEKKKKVMKKKKTQKSE